MLTLPALASLRSAGRRAVAVALVAVALAGCRDDRVLLSFRPAPGGATSYRITVATATTLDLPGASPSPDAPPVELRVDQTVLSSANPDEVRVQIEVTPSGAATRTYVARYDRAAQLTAIDRVEGIPVEALGDLGLTEIFPAAVGAPPDRRLRAGDTWAIDEAVQLPGASAPAQLTGRGKLVELAVVDGHRSAAVHSSATLPLTTDVTSGTGVQHLDGTQTTDLDASYDVTDGSIVTGTAVTVGDFALALSPPPGTPGAPLHGHLTVHVTTTITRL